MVILPVLNNANKKYFLYAPFISFYFNIIYENKYVHLDTCQHYLFALTASRMFYQLNNVILSLTIILNEQHGGTCSPRMLLYLDTRNSGISINVVHVRFFLISYLLDLRAQ